MIDNIFLTFLIAFAIIFFALIGMGIGWLATGTSKMRKGCGVDPLKKPDETCGTEEKSCDICQPQDDKK